MSPARTQVAGTLAYVEFGQARCGCGWKGIGIPTDPAEARTEARMHVCAPKRPCAGRVDHRIAGCVPPNVQRRPCKRYALPGALGCRDHLEDQP